MLFTVFREMFCTLIVSWYEELKPKTLTMSIVTLMGFKWQIVSKTFFREPNPHYTKNEFPLKIPSENVTKSAVSCGFGHIY